MEDSDTEEAADTPPAASMKRALARNTGANAIEQAVRIGSNIILMPFLISSFGLATYGVYLFAASLSGYLALLDLGVGVSLTKLLAEYRAKGDDDHSGRLISSAVAFYAIAGVIGSIALILTSRYLVGAFNFSSTEQTTVRQLLTVAAVFSPVMWPLGLVSSVQAGLNRYDINAVASMIGSALNAAITVAVIMLRLGPVSLVIGMSLTSCSVAIWNWRRALVGLGRRVRIRLSGVRSGALRQLAKMSAYVFAIKLSSSLSYLHGDRLVVGYFVGAAGVAVYEAAARIENLVQQIAGLTSSALVATTSHLGAQGNRDALRQVLLRGTRYTAFLVLPITTGLILLAHPLLVTWLGPRLAAAALPTQVYLSYWLVSVNAVVMWTMIVGTGRLNRVIWLLNLGTLINVGLGLLLTWKLGLIGVILGTVVSQLLITPPYVRIGYRLLGVSFADWVKAVAIPAYLPLGLTVVVVLCGYALHLPSTLAGVAITGLASVFAYWILVFFALLSKAERRDVASLRAAVGGRVRAFFIGAVGASDSRRRTSRTPSSGGA